MYYIPFDLFDVPISDPLRRNVLFRCCFRFSSSSFKAKTSERKSKIFSVTRLFFSHFTFTSINLLLCAMIRRTFFSMAFVFAFRRCKSVKIPSFSLLMTLFEALLFLRPSFSSFTDIALRNIIKKSEWWFIEEKSAQRCLSREPKKHRSFQQTKKTLWISIKNLEDGQQIIEKN